MLEVHVHRLGAAAFDLAAVVAVGAFKTNHSDVTFCSLAALHRNHGGELTTGLLEHVVHFCGIEADALRFCFQPLGGFQGWGRSHIGFKGDGKGLSGFKGLQQGFVAAIHFGLA